MAVIGCAGAPACAKETAVVLGPGSRGTCHRARIRATRWLGRDGKDYRSARPVNSQNHLHCPRKTFVLVRGRDMSRRLLDVVGGVAHGEGNAAGAEHRQIVL